LIEEILHLLLNSSNQLSTLPKVVQRVSCILQFRTPHPPLRIRKTSLPFPLIYSTFNSTQRNGSLPKSIPLRITHTIIGAVEYFRLLAS